MSYCFCEAILLTAGLLKTIWRECQNRLKSAAISLGLGLLDSLRQALAFDSTREISTPAEGGGRYGTLLEVAALAWEGLQVVEARRSTVCRIFGRLAVPPSPATEHKPPSNF
jgi:hypothetical protein